MTPDHNLWDYDDRRRCPGVNTGTADTMASRLDHTGGRAAARTPGLPPRAPSGHGQHDRQQRAHRRRHGAHHTRTGRCTTARLCRNTPTSAIVVGGREAPNT